MIRLQTLVSETIFFSGGNRRKGYNLVQNSYDVNENHDDGFQSWAVGPGGVGTGAVTGIVLRGNVIVNFTDPNQPLRGPLQGIALFDGFFDDWVIENNVVVVDHWHGISVYGARNTTVINNTVVDQSEGDPGATWIRINPHKDGTPSSGNTIRNNIANTYVYDASETDFDHNLEVPFADYSLHFVNFPNDLRLLQNSTAVDAGNDQGAPALDADEASRPVGSSVDQGAYEYGAEAPNPGTGTETNGGTTPTETGTGGTATDWIQPDPSGTAETGGCACDQGGGPTAGWLGLWLFIALGRRTIRT